MSAASAKTQEPSMEEILASIRRIIAEDQDVAKEPEAEAAEEERADEHAGAEDVLELPEPVAFAAPEPEPEPEVQPEPEPEPEPLPDLDVAVPEILFSDEPQAPEPVVGSRQSSRQPPGNPSRSGSTAARSRRRCSPARPERPSARPSICCPTRS